jgi:hypothetical protein
MADSPSTVTVWNKGGSVEGIFGLTLFRVPSMDNWMGESFSAVLSLLACQPQMSDDTGLAKVERVIFTCGVASGGRRAPAPGRKK